MPFNIMYEQILEELANDLIESDDMYVALIIIMCYN